MRISGDPCDPDYVHDDPCTVLLNGRFFMDGVVIEADEDKGTIDFYPFDAQGNYLSAYGNYRIEHQKISGKVRIYRDMGQC
jgi:hypothetical protein